MKNNFNILLGILLLFASCSTDQKQQKHVVKRKIEKVIQVIPNANVSISVEGMVCEMGCGSSIRKALKETEAIKECSFDFKDGRKINTATISFDSTKISKDKIVTVINSLNDNQFKATL